MGPLDTGNGTERVCADLNAEIARLEAPGYRIELIYPADEPHSAVMSKSGERIRLTTQPGAAAPTDQLPDFEPEFRITRAGDEGGEGRAGMRYRDLIPGRLGGRYIASHISIPGGGPVADWAHYHHVAFQLIMVRSGWVRVVYEDQGEPFVMVAGDMVVQPPGIRHRVLESSAMLEVIEIGLPALHATYADHDIVLPTGRVDPNRDFGGQRFLRHVAADTPWTAFGGGEAAETGVSAATEGIAEVRIARGNVDFPAHRGEMVFGFVLAGSARLEYGGDHLLSPADAFVVPPVQPWRIICASADFRLLHVTTAIVTTAIVASAHCA